MTKIKPEYVDDIINMYLNKKDLTLKNISDIYKVDDETIRRILKKNNIENSRIKIIDSKYFEKAKQMNIDGKNQDEIIKELDISRDTLWRLFKKYNYKPIVKYYYHGVT